MEEDGDGDGHSIPGDGAGCSLAVPGWEDGTEPLLSPQAEWRTTSINISFFESFCSTGQHAFNASRETCTVMLTSHEPRSQHWAVQAVLHREYDPPHPAPRGMGWDQCRGSQRGDAV